MSRNSRTTTIDDPAAYAQRFGGTLDQLRNVPDGARVSNDLETDENLLRGPITRGGTNVQSSSNQAQRSSNNRFSFSGMREGIQSIHIDIDP